MLLDIAVFDAYASGFEFANVNLPKNTLDYYVKHPKHPLRPGQYTDDTQMSLAIAELLVSKEEWTPLNIANKFVEVFKRDPREGYAHRFYKFLLSVNTGAEFLANIKPESEKSGAAMRATPLGVIHPIDQMLDMCRIQAQVTHNTPAGICSAIGAASLAHYFIYKLGPVADATDFVVSAMEHIGFTHTGWEDAFDKKKVGVRGMDIVHAALTAIQKNCFTSELLRYCVNMTGDADTVAAIAAGAASNSEEYIQDLPENLILGLENETYGRDYIVRLDESLMKLAKKT